MKAFVRDAIYIPIKHVTADHEDALRNRFEKVVFHKEPVCEKCEYFSERPSDVCDSCANFGGTIKLHRVVEKGEKTFLRLPFGDTKGVQKIFGDDVDFRYKLPEIPMVKKIKFTSELRDYQVPACKAMYNAIGGVLKAPPRSGKTVMSAKVICRWGLKTIILAAQRDWLENFYETFVGSDTQEPMTNASKKRVGFAKKLADFEKYDIALATPQTFLSPKGKKLLQKIKAMFSVMVVDEVQTVPATEFSIIVSQFECMHKIGLSGTPERKDGKEWTAYKLMGPVFYDTPVEQLRPEVHIVNTKFTGPVPKTWVHMVNKLETNPERLKLIAEEALRDVKAGHLVLIPFARVTAIRALAKAINRMAGKNIAAAFYGSVKKEKRKAIIEYARKYKLKVVVGNTRLLSTGINIPRASMLYEVSPSSNQPKAQQRFARVLTPMEGKPTPGVKYFLDDIDVRRSCIRSEFFQTLYPRFRPKMRGDVKEALYSYMNRKKMNSTTGRRTYSGGAI